jgi:hypothetical protein
MTDLPCAETQRGSDYLLDEGGSLCLGDMHRCRERTLA